MRRIISELYRIARIIEADMEDMSEEELATLRMKEEAVGEKAKMVNVKSRYTAWGRFVVPKDWTLEDIKTNYDILEDLDKPVARKILSWAETMLEHFKIRRI